MDNVRLGPVGRLSVYRPVLSALVLAAGLAALVEAGVRAPGGAGPAIGDFVLALMLIAAAPFALSTLAPRRLLRRALYAALIIAGAFAVAAFGPRYLTFVPPGSANLAAGFSIALATLALFGGLIGVAARFGVLAILAAILGAAGAYSLLGMQGLATGPSVATCAAIAGMLSISLILDFADDFAAGLDRMRAAGVAARHSAAPTLFAGVAAAIAFSLATLGAGPQAQATRAGFIVLALIVAAAPAFALTAGALASRRHTEMLATAENRRRRAFRSFWRPLRRLYTPSASLAAIAIASIAVIAAVLDVSGRTPLAVYAFAPSAALLSAVIFVSARVGAFVFLALLVSIAGAEWIWLRAGFATLAPDAAFAALALGGVLVARIAVTWRNARNPRLNSRETAERAMALAVPNFLAGYIVVAMTLGAARLSGVWPESMHAFRYFTLQMAIAMLLAPALMTALSQAVRRDYS